MKLHRVPQKDNNAPNFLAKLADIRVLSPDGVFINDLHEPSARVLKDLTKTHSNTNLVPRGFDPPMCPNPDQMLGGSNLGASMATSPPNIAVMTFDLVD